MHNIYFSKHLAEFMDSRYPAAQLCNKMGAIYDARPTERHHPQSSRTT